MTEDGASCRNSRVACVGVGGGEGLEDKAERRDEHGEGCLKAGPDRKAFLLLMLQRCRDGKSDQRCTAVLEIASGD